MSFRRAGIHVPEDAISLPEEPICGPNMEIENKFFLVTVTINNTEKVSVKCIIHHRSTYISDKLPRAEEVAEKPRLPAFPAAKAETGFNATSDLTTAT
jgi:large subunit ribosomal protein L9